MSHRVGKVRRRAARLVGPLPRGGAEAVRRVLRGLGAQAKLRLGAPDDACEREADAVAARVMNARAPSPVAADASGPRVQRMCAECEEEEKVRRKTAPEPQPEEEEEEVQAKCVPEAAAPAPAIAALRGGGRPLAPPVRAFFEPRFGADFSQVRVHDGPTGQAAARALRARAFTRGHDIAFAPGEYAPLTPAGGRLMAHELTHVLQQRDADAPIRRWAVGTAPAPEADWTVVPQDPSTEDHTDRLAAAEAIVRRVVASARCTNFFRDNCGLGEGAAALRNAFDQARIYFIDRDDDTFGETHGVTRNIAYNRRVFRIGRFFMASTLLHEMFHTCDPSFDARDEIDAETAVETCRLYTPMIFELSSTSGSPGDRITILGTNFGGRQGPADRVELGGVSAPVVSWAFTGEADSSEVRIVVEVPAGAKTGELVVINNNVRSNARRFVVN
jgi:hypothetical protein